MFLEGIPNEDNFNPNDTFFLSRNSNFSNLGDSNFFSTYGDKSMICKQLNEIDKQAEDDNKSNFTIELDLERQVDSLLYEEDDLNDAKYLENDRSNWSSTSNLFKNQQNLTTPNIFAKNILLSQNDKDTKLTNFKNELLKTNSTSELVKKLNINEKNTKNEINLNILDKNQDTLTLDSNTNNKTGSIIPTWKMNNMIGAGGGGGDYFISPPPSNISSFDFHSNSVDFNNLNLMKEFHYGQASNNSNYYNKNYFKNNTRYNKFQQDYCQNLRDYYSNGKIMGDNYIDKTKTFTTNINNNINFSEASSINSYQSLNIPNNRHILYHNYHTKNNYIRDMKSKIKEDSNRNYNENLKLMIKDQKGSKYIQKKIEEKSPEFLNKLYEQMKNNLFEIMTNQYGNYVVQKFFDNCDKKLILKMLYNLSTNPNSKILYEISINNYGTRPLQKMIENISSIMTQQDINMILNFVKGNVLNLIKDINGNRIIQCIIQNIKNKEQLSPLYKELNDNLLEIIKTKSGCCVFAKILTNITDEDLDLMVDIILANINSLINDEFGNISIKRIIKLNNEIYNNKIFELIKDNLIHLGCQKFSSNVIEACVDNTTSLKKKVINKLIEKENNILDMILDQFGNYIIQTMLQNSENNEFEIIIKNIKQNEKKIKQTQHGKIIFEKLMKNYKKFLVENKVNKEIIPNNNNNNYIKKDYHNGKKNKNKYNVKKKKK